jgi:hypothetical protein
MIIADQPRRKPKPYLNMPFGGLIECQECGSIMSPSHVVKKTKDDFFLMNVIQAAQNQTRCDHPTGIEPVEKWGDISTKTLKLSLQKFNGMWARRTGIEKTLLVQEGIKKVRYSKESVPVDFYWERFLDGGSPSAAPAHPGTAPQIERPTPANGVGPSLRSSTHGMVFQTSVAAYCPGKSRQLYTQLLGRFPLWERGRDRFAGDGVSSRRRSALNGASVTPASLRTGASS